MIKKSPTISPAEFKVLEILWKLSPQSSSQIIDALKDTESWSNQTVKTLLSRLVTKKLSVTSKKAIVISIFLC